jgi:hypothetical protein
MKLKMKLGRSFCIKEVEGLVGRFVEGASRVIYDCLERRLRDWSFDCSFEMEVVEQQGFCFF